ncbi:MAG TPA: phage terminase small subunit P27 family, partial [Roseiflexaceae bacterium]|nr:phage terminase small subunit P27 family [Roseiflexaceae bacterium]
MGSRGPAPTPSSILKLRGSFRADRSHDELIPPEGEPDCPDWLDEEAKAAWTQLSPLLKPMGVLTKVDGNALSRYCQLWARWKKAELFIQKHGDTYPIKDDSGKIKCLMPFPQVAIAHKLAALLGRLEAEFGLTPSARSRITLPVGTRVPTPE